MYCPSASLDSVDHAKGACQLPYSAPQACRSLGCKVKVEYESEDANLSSLWCIVRYTSGYSVERTRHALALK